MSKNGAPGTLSGVSWLCVALCAKQLLNPRAWVEALVRVRYLALATFAMVFTVLPYDVRESLALGAFVFTMGGLVLLVCAFEAEDMGENTPDREENTPLQESEKAVSDQVIEDMYTSDHKL